MNNKKPWLIAALIGATVILVVAVVLLVIKLTDKDDSDERGSESNTPMVTEKVVDPQEEKYRKGNDIATISDCMAVAEKVAIDPQFDLPAGAEFCITISDGKLQLSVNNGGTDSSASLDEWKFIVGDHLTLESESFKALNAKLVGTLQNTGAVNWTGQGIEPLCEFSVDFQRKWF